jgi:hypothetical protein
MRMTMNPEDFKAAMQRLEAVLNERWEPQRHDATSFVFPWVAGSIPLTCFVQINTDMQGFIFRAMPGLPVEPKLRPIVGEFIQRLNYEQPIGNWAINLDTGDVRFKNGVYFRGGELTENMIRNVIDSSLFFVYHDIMGFVKLQTGSTLAEAMAARGKDHGVGVTKGMKVAGNPPR